MPHDEHRMTHHVVEHTAALQLAAPEPRHVRTTVLLGRAREVGTSGCRRAARPDECVASLDLRREHLVLEIAVRQSYALHELDDALRLVYVARERLFTRDAAQSALSALDGVHDLFDVLD